MTRLFISSLALSLLAGCSTIFDPNGASSDYSCINPDDVETQEDAATKGITCKTPFAVYKSTHGKPPLRESDLPVGVTMKDLESGKVKMRGDANPNDGLPHPGFDQSYRAPSQLAPQNQPEYARPVRQPATVMRIWIAPWVDKRDDLHFPSVIYTEIQPRRWAFGEEEFSGRGMVVPTKQLSTVPGAPVSPRGTSNASGSSQSGSGQEISKMNSGVSLPRVPGQ